MKLPEEILDKSNQLYDLSQKRIALQDILTDDLRGLKLRVVDDRLRHGGVRVARVLAVNATGIGSVLVRFLPLTASGQAGVRDKIVQIQDLEVIPDDADR